MNEPAVTRIQTSATDPKVGMTVEQLGSFVQQCLRNDLPTDQPVRVRVTMSGRLKSIEISG